MSCGLKVLSTQRWYGGGYCGVCGSKEVIAHRVRYWDPDDGWKTGVLCVYCTEDCKARGPEQGDFALSQGDQEFRAQVADLMAELGDDDGSQTEFEDLFG